uniref:Uncharacterized protein n=1 Tax=Pinctada fucata TaxID=50426 RepID=A0A194AMI4_PINFU
MIDFEPYILHYFLPKQCQQKKKQMIIKYDQTHLVLHMDDIRKRFLCNNTCIGRNSPCTTQRTITVSM